MKQTVGDLIKQRRNSLGLTLEQVGNHVGVSKSTVKKWESGFIANMKRNRIELLAEILQISPNELISDRTLQITEKSGADNYVNKLDTKKCPGCGKEIPTSANFCTHCGKKLNAVCNCWVKEKPYNCGLDKCPGIRLFLIEKRSREKPYRVYEFNELGNRHSATVSFEMAYHDWLKLENSAAFREMVDCLRKIQTTGGE